LSRSGALAVDDRRRRAGFAADLLARRDIEPMMDAFQRAVPVPQHEVIVRAVLFGGRSFGSAFHWQPVDST